MLEVEGVERDWDFTDKDFEKSKIILQREILPDNIINEKNAFEALVYCLLSIRKSYDQHMNLFTDMKYLGFLEPDRITEEKEWKRILRERNSLYNKKYKYLRNYNDFWNESDFPERLIADVKSGRENGEELREELVKDVTGVGYKTASYLLLKHGYPVMPLDTWHVGVMEHLGINEKYGIKLKERYVRPSKYKKAEADLKKIGFDEYGLTPPEFSALILSKHSKWTPEASERYFQCITNPIIL